LQRAQSVDVGFELKRVLVVRQDLRAHGYSAARRTEFYRSFSERVRQLPGVKAVGLATGVPLQGGFPTGPAAGSASAPGRQVAFNFVSPEFFSALAIPLVAGRNFREGEATQSAPVAIVNEALARVLWPGSNPVGQQLHGFFKEPAEVVGVVRNARDGRLWEAGEPCMYFLDRPGVKGSWGSSDQNMAILIRTESDPRNLVADVRETMRGLDGELWPTIRTLEGNLESQLAPSRTGAALSAALGLLALAVTAIGLYGVVAYATSQRTREFGVRMALGARPGDVVQLVLGQGWRLVAIGVLAGMAGAVALAHVLARFLYGLSPLDPIAFGGVALFLAAIATIACYLPARRAAKINPIVALRTE
jgi:predicted permease